MASGTRRGSRERGAELIEFALVLPLLLALVAGIIDFGFLFQRHLVLQNAAREGARVSVLPSYGSEDAIRRAHSYVGEGLGLDVDPTTGRVDGCNVTFSTDTMDTDDVGGPRPAFTVVTVTVTMTYSYTILGPILNLLNGTGNSLTEVTLTAVSTMRREA